MNMQEIGFFKWDYVLTSWNNYGNCTPKLNKNNIMKKLLLSLSLFVSSFIATAQVSTCVFTTSSFGSDQIICNATNLGSVNPCQGLTFIVNNYLPVPSGFATTKKFEWFVNGVLVKTTIDPSDPYLNWIIVSNTTNVYCNVTYQKSDGTLSTPYTSSTFTPLVKSLDFPIEISTSTPAANYGCASSIVSYSLPETACTGGGICDFIYDANGNYNITWEAPAGWVQTSISNNGSDVSFIPDASSAGTLTATIHLNNCDYTETRTFNIVRGTQTPSFTNSAVVSCTSSASISINPTCGAVDYTYLITGNPGVTFASNGLQALTTTSTTVNVAISGGSSLNTINAKANYPGSHSSANSAATLTAGAPQAGPITFLLIDPVMGKIQAIVDPVPGATSYNWYKNGVLIIVPVNHGNLIQFPITRDLCDMEYDISVEVVNNCGTSARTHANAYAPCDPGFVVSPNPASGTVTVSSVENKLQSSETNTIQEVRIYDWQGTLKKYQKFPKIKRANMNIAELPNGNYFIEIINGSKSEKHQLIIQK
jgi:hypothetical protein